MRRLLVVVSIILLAGFIRFWQLGDFPPSLSIDEISFAFNANSIFQTSHDEHGVYLPLSFKSLGDYKLPHDIYLRVPIFALFGVSEFNTRLPVAAFSVLTVFVVIVLLQKLKFSFKVSIFTGFWFSLLGWHIFYSRSSFEAITALFYILLGLYWFLIWKKNNSPLTILGASLVWGLSIWTYNTQRIFVPLLVLFLYLQIKPKIKPIVVMPILVFIAFCTALIALVVFDRSSTGRAVDLFVGWDKILEQYLNYFSLKFWFWKAGIITPKDFQGLGLLNLVDLPIFILGIIGLFKSKNIFLKKLTLFWFLAGPIAAGFTKGDPSPIRVIVWMPFFIFIMSMGFETLLKQRKIWLIGYLVGLAFCFSYFMDLYSRNFMKFYADQWHFGYKQAAIYVCQNHDKFDQIIVTDKYGIVVNKIKTVPYLYFLIYCNIDPEKYLQNREIYNISFRQPQWFYDSQLSNTLLIGSQWDFPENFPKNWIDKQIDFPTGEPALLFIETSPKKTSVIK